VAAPRTGGTQIASRSIFSRSPATKGRIASATVQSNAGAQIGCAPYGKLM
jgi:hypothetical protein